MPIPSGSCPEDIPPNVCCDTTWLIGDRIRTVAFNAVLACVDPDCSDQPMRSYTTVGTQIQDPLGDAVIIRLTDLRIRTPNFDGTQSPFPVTRARYRLELLESGWPQPRVENETIFVPDADLVNALSKHVQGHGEKMWRAVASGASHGSGPSALFDQAVNPHLVQRNITVGPLEPLPVGAHIVGYGMFIEVDTMLP